MKRTLLSLAALAAVATPAVSLADPPPAAPVASPAPGPIRHLVYYFTFDSSGDLNVHGSNGYASDTRSGSGNSRDYSGNLTDKGLITVDVVREQPDHGLILSIAEQGEATRRAEPATCVVYGNTNIICDPDKQLNSEEYTLLRFLGTTFVDPAQIDAKQHWAINSGGSGITTTADYTITKNDSGMMAIDETRVVKQKGAASVRTDVDTKILYDFPKLVPDSVQEYSTQRENQPGGQIMTTTIQTTLKLQSDSMTAKS